jgi:CTP:molybdopterin cytidylyltransferase MocA
MKLGAVILAAGAGMRLGGVAKALIAGRDGRSFLARILDVAREVGLHDAVVVVGPPHETLVSAHAAELGARVVRNPDPARGMGSSIALGFAAIAGGASSAGAGECDAAWLWPVDHPDVEAGTLRALVAALGTHDAAKPVIGGRGGHPPLVARALFSRLAAVGEDGARGVFASADVIAVDVGDAGTVRDVDTAADLEALT